MARLWNQLRRQRRQSSELTATWKKADEAPKGNINIAKREMLWAWIREGRRITNTLLKETRFLVLLETSRTTGTWVTPGRLKVLVGDEEAAELMQELKSRPSASNPRRKEYYYLLQEEISDRQKGKTTVAWRDECDGCRVQEGRRRVEAKR